MRTLVALLTVTGVALAQEPGFTFRITPAGFDYANDVAEAELHDIIQTTPIPDFEVESEDGDAKGKASNLKITEYNKPSFAYNVQPGRIAWGAHNGDIEVSGDWLGSYRTFLGTITADGTFVGSAKRSSVQISIAFGRSSDNHLEMRDVGCTVNIGDLSLRIRGGFLGAVLNIFSGLIARSLRPILQNEICAAATEFIEEDVNELLKTFPLNIPLVEVYSIDAGMVADPEINAQKVETFHNGEIRALEHDTGATPFGPAPLVTAAADNRKMLNIIGSDYIVNSMFHHGHEAGLLEILVTKESFPDFADLLAFECPPSLPLCLGTIFPPLQQQFPNGFGELEIRTTRRPQINIGTDFGTIEGAIEMRLYAATQQGSRIRAIDMKLSSNGFLALFIKDGDTSEPKLAAVVELSTLNLDDLTSLIGDIDTSEVQVFLDQVKTLLTLVINSEFEQGIPIPDFEGVAGLRNTEIILRDHTVVLNTDVYVNPLFKRK